MIYFFDGSKEAFLTAFLEAYPDEEAFLTSTQKQLTIGQESVFVQADDRRAAKAERRFLQLDKNCLSDLSVLLRSGQDGHEQIAFRYLRKLARAGRPVRRMLADEDVVAAVECMNRVRFEIHRLHGFIRFMESASGALYAPFSPDNDVCDLLVPHFRARLPQFPFVLHDVSRKKAAIYDGKNTFVAPLERAEVVLSADKQGWQALWKRYYASVNIPSRERLKQMRSYMPVRYWKFLPEKIAPTD